MRVNPPPAHESHAPRLPRGGTLNVLRQMEGVVPLLVPPIHTGLFWEEGIWPSSHQDAMYIHACPLGTRPRDGLQRAWAVRTGEKQ